MNWLTLSKTALNEVSSEYVIFLSADDYWLENDYLLNLHSHLSLSTSVAIAPNFEISQNERHSVDTSILINNFKSNSRILRIINFLKSWNNTHLVYSLTRRSLFENLLEGKDSAPTRSLASDWWWAFKIIKESPSFQSSGSTYVRNRIKRNHDDKKIGDFTKNNAFADINKAKKFLKIILNSSFYHYRILFKNDFERKLNSKSFTIISLKVYFFTVGFFKIITEVIDVYRIFKSGKSRI
jgi:hypothetical protein